VNWEQIIQMSVTSIGLLLVYIFQGRQIKSLKTEIESQNSIVDNAMKYAKDLDYDKIRGLLELEYTQKIDKIKNDGEERIKNMELTKSQQVDVIKELNDTLKALEVYHSMEVGRVLKNTTFDYQTALLVLIQEIIIKNPDEKHLIIDKIKTMSLRDIYNTSFKESLALHKEIINHITLKNMPVMPSSDYKNIYKNVAQS